MICATPDCAVTVDDIFDSDGEKVFECGEEEDDGEDGEGGEAKDLCKMTNKQMKKAQKKAGKFERKAQNGKFPDHVQQRFQTKLERLETMQGQLEKQLTLLNNSGRCGVTSPGN